MNATEVKHAARDFLSRRPWILRKQVEVLCDDAGVIESSIAAALAKLGICVVVGNLTARATSTASRHIVCSSTLVLTLYETPTVNRLRADHADIAALAEYLAGCLNLAPLAQEQLPGDTVLPVFTGYAINWQTPASASATCTYTGQTTINPPED